MNFLEYRYENGRPLVKCDLVRFNRYEGEGSRSFREWIGIVTEIKAHKMKVFLPVLNTYEEIRNNVIIGFEASKYDMSPVSKAAQILREAAPVVKKLAKQYTYGTEEL